MTKEEAIKELELIAHLTMWNDKREAVEMAIEALQTEPKTGKWELDPRGKGMKNEIAVRKIKSLDYYLQNHTNYYSEKSHRAMMMAIEALQAEPSARPLTAHAISDKDGNIRCSNCGSFECWGNYCMDCGAKMSGGACWSYDYERTIVKSNFCPNCGAKMDKGGDSE